MYVCLSVCLSVCSIQGIRWQDHITNLEVLDQTKSTSIEATIVKAQLRWVGHVIRMEECRMPRRMMYGELQVGNRNQDRPKLRYKNTVKANLQWCHINPRDWRDMPWIDQNGETRLNRTAANFEGARCQNSLLPERETPQSSLGSDHN